MAVDKKGQERRSAHKRRAKYLAQRAQRTRERHQLALQIGLVILNEMERGGRMYIKDYQRIYPRWAIATYEGVRS